ncbi:MAG TPA: ABC transporter ATP-binding protein [Saprospiraceae bacterium]|nr:ABC transporter ATP-binding protein [Saprospiraceae bacterium]
MQDIWRELRRLRPFFSRKDKLTYLGLFGLMVLGALFDVIGIGAVPAFVAMLSMPEKLQQYPVVIEIMQTLQLQFDRALVIKGATILILLFIIKNAYLVWFYNRQYRIIEYHRIRLADRLFSAYMYAPYSFHLSRNSAELLRNVQVETLEIVRTVISPVLEIAMGIFMTFFTGGLLGRAAPWIGLGAVLFIGGGSALFYISIRKRLNHYGQVAKKEWKESVKAINQGLGALVEARILDKESYFTTIFRRSVSIFAKVERLRQVVSKTSPAVVESIAVGGLLAGVILMLLAGVGTETMLPIMALFGVAAVRLRQSTSQIVNGLSQLQYGIVAIPHVTDDIQFIESSAYFRQRSKNRAQALPFEHTIEIENITFAYPESDTNVIEGLSAIIKKGESVAFVGPTGSGKSTIINILLGLLEPQSGTIKIDGQPTQENLTGWLRHVGYIPQTIFLLDDSIRNNIAIGIEPTHIDDDKVWKAAKAAQLDEFIRTLPQGLDTIVGERGIRLSGGQRQRVGLARALYHEPEVLVMDEATSSLDNHTESLVMQALNSIKEGRTFIMIAHRLSTVEQCDRLYFLKQGKVAAVGTFNELVEQYNDFRQMAEVN